MQKISFILSLFVIVASELKAQKTSILSDERIILISTDYGNMQLKLYNQTYKHRDNFIKLTSEGFYDSTLFHRVIKNFMIQGGDPDSKNAKPGETLGNGDVGYTIPAEFIDSLFHKKGALAAARQGDNVNPQKASSGCQFYIVQGKVFTEAELDAMEARINNATKQKIFSEIIHKEENKELKSKYIAAQQANDTSTIMKLSSEIDILIDKEMSLLPPFKFTKEQRIIYTTVGGTPHLDKNYTVFGEVIEGLEVVDKIASLPTSTTDRPVSDVRVKIRIIK